MSNLAVSMPIDNALNMLLENALREWGLSIPLDQQQQLLQYVALLNKWNKTYNLTAVREPARMIGVHVLDSLAVLPHLGTAGNMLDVGSGGGLPGIPLAIVRPNLHVTMLDSLQKKTVFIRQAMGELDLKNATVVCERVENFQPEKKFDVVISRAFAELSDFVNGAGHLVADGGCMLAMKGVNPVEEIARLALLKPSNSTPGVGFEAKQVIELNVPQVDAQRHLVILKRS